MSTLINSRNKIFNRTKGTKHDRRLSVVSIFLVLVILALTSCNTSSKNSSSTQATVVPTATITSTTTVETRATTTPQSAPMNDDGCEIVGYILDGAERGYEDSISDWDTLIFNAAMAASDETSTKILVERNIDDSNTPLFYQAVKRLVGQNACIIFATSANYISDINTVAELYPDVHFLNSSGFNHWTEDSLFGVYHGRMYEVRFLQGFIAAGNSLSGKLGYVSPAHVPEVYRNLNFFTLGAQFVNPDIQVLVEWTDSWRDRDAEIAATTILLEKGVDVIAHNQSGDTVPLTVQAWNDKNSAHVRYITYLSVGDAPGNWNEAYLAGALYNWTPIFTEVINSVNDGTYQPTAIWNGLAELAVSIDLPSGTMLEVIPNASDIVREKVIPFVFFYVLNNKDLVSVFTPTENEIETPFPDGIHISDGRVFTPENFLSDEVLSSMNFLVEGVVSGYIN